MIGAAASHVFVGHFDGLWIVGQLQINIDRPMQRLDRGTAIHDEFVESCCRLAAIARFVEAKRQVVDAFLVAGLAFEFFECVFVCGAVRPLEEIFHEMVIVKV